MGPPPSASIVELASAPAEKALLNGIRLYEEAQYIQAETELTRAVELKPKSGKDWAIGYKYLAFLYCTSDRLPLCEKAFVAARTVDPSFVLTKTEQGHPLWGPVYRKALGIPPSRQEFGLFFDCL